MSGLGGGALPARHARWFTVLTQAPSPAGEAAATCDDCVMCAGVQRSHSRITFSPNVKCCSYTPHLPNFLAGAALVGAGGESVRRRIRRRAGVTPFGIGLSHRDIEDLLDVQGEFGRSERMRCPHYVADTGGCGIWNARNAVCSTWFCRHDRGAASLRYWQAVRDLLMAVEERAATYCVEHSGLPPRQVADVLEHRATVRATLQQANEGRIVGTSDPDDHSDDWYARMWGTWLGREEEWFTHCTTLVDDAGPGLLETWRPGVGHLVTEVVRLRAELATPGAPDPVVFAPGHGSEATADVLRLVGYSPFDPLVVPAHLEPSLWLFDGRPTRDVLAEIAAGPFADLADGAVELLHDFGLVTALVPPVPAVVAAAVPVDVRVGSEDEIRLPVAGVEVVQDDGVVLP